MMGVDATTLLVVGGAVLGPHLLAHPVTDTIPVVPPREVKPFHRSAMNVLAGPILGISAPPTTDAAPNNDATTSAFQRLQQLFRALIPLRGSLSATSPGFPKLSGGDCLQLVDAFTRALRAGATDTLAGDTYAFGAAVSGQLAVLEDILNGDRAASGGLGGAVAAMVAANNAAVVDPSPNFDATGVLRAVVDVATEMDRQGVPNPLSQAPEVLDSIGTAILDLPATLSSAASFLAGKASGVIGDAAAKILFSTPVLVAVAGYVTYKAVTK
jgi:hypothetical protein